MNKQKEEILGPSITINIKIGKQHNFPLSALMTYKRTGLSQHHWVS